MLLKAILHASCPNDEENAAPRRGTSAAFQKEEGPSEIMLEKMSRKGEEERWDRVGGGREVAEGDGGRRPADATSLTVTTRSNNDTGCYLGRTTTPRFLLTPSAQ